ncbi:hypothetical protein HDE_02293 [Halotydeus destructor]|nr:hypothetical protein HDE_02293 [Halotydeus destructor]
MVRASSTPRIATPGRATSRIPRPLATKKMSPIASPLTNSNQNNIQKSIPRSAFKRSVTKVLLQQTVPLDTLVVNPDDDTVFSKSPQVVSKENKVVVSDEEPNAENLQPLNSTSVSETPDGRRASRNAKRTLDTVALTPRCSKTTPKSAKASSKKRRISAIIHPRTPISSPQRTPMRTANRGSKETPLKTIPRPSGRVYGRLVSIKKDGFDGSMMPLRTTESYIIGRDMSCDVTVMDETVSLKHCSLQFTPAGPKIISLKMSALVKINGAEMFVQQILNNKDIIQLGGRKKFRVDLIEQNVGRNNMENLAIATENLSGMKNIEQNASDPPPDSPVREADDVDLLEVSGTDEVEKQDMVELGDRESSLVDLIEPNVMPNNSGNVEIAIENLEHDTSDLPQDSSVKEDTLDIVEVLGVSVSDEVKKQEMDELGDREHSQVDLIEPNVMPNNNGNVEIAAENLENDTSDLPQNSSVKEDTLDIVEVLEVSVSDEVEKQEMDELGDREHSRVELIEQNVDRNKLENLTIATENLSAVRNIEQDESDLPPNSPVREATSDDVDLLEVSATVEVEKQDTVELGDRENSQVDLIEPNVVPNNTGNVEIATESTTENLEHDTSDFPQDSSVKEDTLDIVEVLGVSVSDEVNKQDMSELGDREHSRVDLIEQVVMTNNAGNEEIAAENLSELKNLEHDASTPSSPSNEAARDVQEVLEVSMTDEIENQHMIELGDKDKFLVDLIEQDVISNNSENQDVEKENDQTPARPVRKTRARSAKAVTGKKQESDISAKPVEERKEESDNNDKVDPTPARSTRRTRAVSVKVVDKKDDSAILAKSVDETIEDSEIRQKDAETPARPVRKTRTRSVKVDAVKNIESAISAKPVEKDGSEMEKQDDKTPVRSVRKTRARSVKLVEEVKEESEITESVRVTRSRARKNVDTVPEKPETRESNKTPQPKRTLRKRN